MRDLAATIAVGIRERRESARDLEMQQSPTRLGDLAIRRGAHEIVDEVPLAAGGANDHVPL